LDCIRNCQANNFAALLDDFESQPATKREAALAFRRLLDLEARQLVRCQQKEFYGTIRIRVL
jgi:chromatin segregation and condensation protein Rec8/ScpA/Scc1 (kleisin family)